MYINDSPGRSIFGKRLIASLLMLSCLISLSINTRASAIPFAKAKESDSEEDSPLAVPKVKLTREQQNEFNSSLKNGNTYLKQQNFELAQICFNRCVTLDPSSSEAHLGLASSNLGLRKMEPCQMEIFEALRCNPNSVAARFLLGDIMMKDCRWDEAGGQYLQVLKTEPENLVARGNLAACFQMMGEIEPAIGQYKYILEKEPRMAQAAFNLGVAYEMKGMVDEAAKYYKKTVELSPKHVQAFISLAKCLIAKKNYSEAQVLLNHVKKDMGGSSYYFYHLMQGCLNEVQGDKRGAIEEYTKAVALNPQDGDSHKALARMLESGTGSKIGSSGKLSGGKISGLKTNFN